MKYKLKLPNLPKLTQGLAAAASVFTMVMAPVAQGAEADRITKQQVQAGLAQMGLNKSITVGEFYAKNKDLYPPRIQKLIESFVTQYKNQLMPQFDVKTLKGTDGNEVPTIEMTQGKELVTIQLFGQQEKWAKFQNTNLTEIDVINFTDMVTHISDGDEKFRKPADADTAKVTTAHKFTGYPDVTADVWYKMTQKQRAAYILNMRLLWNDARKVLIEAEKRNLNTKTRKTSLNEAPVEKWNWLLSVLNSDAEAAGAKKASKDIPKGTIATVKAGAGSMAFVSGDNCIVAGYVSKYNSSKCAVEGVVDSYTGSANEVVKAANDECVSTNGPSSVACNPYVYGTPYGHAACVDSSNADFQKATHADGPCEAKSSLGTPVDFLKGDLKNGKRYDANNRLLSDDEIKAKMSAEQAANPAMVEKFINGLLSFNAKDPKNPKNQINFKEPLTAESLAAVKGIKDTFDSEIKKAKESCEAATKNKNNEKNFWGACDQLHRRFVNIAQFLGTENPGCKDGSKIDPDSLMCVCSSGTSVLPGTACSTPQPTPTCPVPPPQKPPVCVVQPTPPTPGQPTPPVNCAEKYPGAVGVDKDCNCPGGQVPKEVTSEGEGADKISQFSCTPDAQKPPHEVEKCDTWCKVGKAALYVAGGALVLWGLKALFTVKKPKLNSAGDSCGTTTTCPQTCSNTHMVWRSDLNACGCALCPAGQSVTDASLCTCSSTSTTTTYTCPDGVTKVTDLTLCPATKYTCWDGSTVTNPLNCPEKPSTSKSSGGKVQK